MILLALAACNGPDTDDTSVLDGEIAAFEVTLPNEIAPLVRHVHVETDQPSTLRIVAAAGDHTIEVAFPEEATTHDHLVLGFHPGLTYQVTAYPIFMGEVGQEVSATVDTTTAGPWPHLPTAEIVTDDAVRRAPGDTLVPLRCVDSSCGEPNEVVVAYDEAGEIVYLLDIGQPDGNDTMQDAVEYDGGLLVLTGMNNVSAVHYAWDGTELARWRIGALTTDTTDVPTAWAETFHHDLIAHPAVSDHFLALGRYPLSGVAYPTDYVDPGEIDANATISDDVAIEFATDGTVIREARMSDYFPTARIGYDSLDTVNGTNDNDWAHTNAIQYDPADGGWVVSMRNQDAVVKLDPETPGKIAWIAGVPDNWPETYDDVLLTPIGSPFAWQYHQHGALLLDEGNGIKRLLVYDNGNAQTTPYSGIAPLVLPAVGEPVPAGLQSRVVSYTIDEVARTIRQDWSFDGPADGPLFCEAVGDVDLLANGNALSTWGFLQTLPGGTQWYEDAGRGDKGVRVIEFDPATLNEVWHLHLSTDRTITQKGVTAYRSERIPTLAGRVID